MHRSSFVGLACALLWACGVAHGATPAKKTHPKATVGSKAGAARKKRVPAHSAQLTPTPERYKEIQQALASKGYLSPDQANGQWTDASSEALKRFQADQNLEPTGKINSLSLIALGLGPKYDTTTGP